MNQTVWRKSCYCAGGSRVRKIQEDSKSEILISKKTRKDNGRIVTITGTMQQIQTAKILLKNTLKIYQNLWLTLKIEISNLKLFWSNIFPNWQNLKYEMILLFHYYLPNTVKLDEKEWLDSKKSCESELFLRPIKYTLFFTRFNP